MWTELDLFENMFFILSLTRAVVSILDVRVENSRDGDGMDAMVVEASPSPPFLFEEFIEDIQDVILGRFLDLPTLLSLGYTSKAFLSRVKKVLKKSRGEVRFQHLFVEVAKLGYFELLEFFLLEISSRLLPGYQEKGVVSEAIAHGHVQFVRRLMTTRDDQVVGFFLGERIRLPAHKRYFPSFLSRPLSKSNSPAMFDMLMRANIELNLLSLAKDCIEPCSVDLLRHIFGALDVQTSLKLLTHVPMRAISCGAVAVLDLFINELKLIRVEGNAFIVTLGDHCEEVLFERAWLSRNLLEMSIYLVGVGVKFTYSLQIGFDLLIDANPKFLVYLEQKGIDYRDLVGKYDFVQLFRLSVRYQLLEKSQCSFYNMVFRDRRILEKLDSDLTESLVRFVGSIVQSNPGVGLPLVRWIYDESPWRHSLPHPFDLLFDGYYIARTEEVLRFCIEFSWPSRIDDISFFMGIQSLDASNQSSYVRIIAEFIELRKRDISDLPFNILIIKPLLLIHRLSLKTFHEILLLLPPVNDSEFSFLSEFLWLKCGSATELDSFASIVEWMETHLGRDVPSTPNKVISHLLASGHPKILSVLFDRGLPMKSDTVLSVLRHFVTEAGSSIAEINLLDNILEKLRMLKERGAVFPKSVLYDAFTDLESTDGLLPLFSQSKRFARIFDFLIDDCGCDLHANVLFAALRVVEKAPEDYASIIKTIEYLINRRCPKSDECFQLAIWLDKRYGETRFVDMLTHTSFS